jgi:hypothetical protein
MLLILSSFMAHKHQVYRLRLTINVEKEMNRIRILGYT